MQQYPQQQVQGSQPQFQYPYPQQQMQAQQAHVKYVGFWGRVIPSLIDSFVLGILNGVLNAMSLFTTVIAIKFFLGVVSILLTFLYPIVMEAMFGATVGKFILGMRVRKVDGSPIGWKEAIIRNLVFIIEGFTLGIITIISIARSPMRQRWGDKIAGCVVVRQ